MHKQIESARKLFWSSQRVTLLDLKKGGVSNSIFVINELRKIGYRIDRHQEVIYYSDGSYLEIEYYWMCLEVAQAIEAVA